MTEEKKQKEAKEKQPAEAEDKKTEQVQDKAAASMNEEKAEEKHDIKLSAKMKEIISLIEGMTVLELSTLVKALEDKFGVTAAQPIMVAGAVGTQAAGVPQEEEKTSFTVVLASAGSNKIQVIKEIRAITTLGLKEAKDLVESAPKPIKEGATKEEAQEIKKKIEATGAKIELK